MTECAFAIVPSRNSDVYSYGVVLLELLTRKKAILGDEEQVTTLVSWARSILMERGKIETIVDSYLASAFPNSAVLAWQVTEVLSLALKCTERNPRKRPTMKDVIGFYQQGIFKLSCDDVVCNGAQVVVDVGPQPYVPVVSTNPVSNTQGDSYLHGESSVAAKFNVETEPADSNDFSWWDDANQFQLGVYAWDDWNLMSTPTTGVDGLVVKLMGSGKLHAKQVAATALVVPEVTYTWPYLVFLPAVIGPVVTQPFNWFFLSCWAQYMYQQKSLKSQLNSYFITPIKDSST